PPDIAHERAGGLVTRQPSPYGRGHGLVDQADPAGRGVEAAVVDRAALHGGGAGRHAHDHLGVHEALAVVHLADEVLDHLLGHFEVGDDPVAHRTDRLHVAGRTAQHLLGLDAHRVHHLAAA